MVTMTEPAIEQVTRSGEHGWALTYLFLEDVYTITGVPMPESVVWLVGAVRGEVTCLDEFEGLVDQLAQAHAAAEAVLRHCGYEVEFSYGYVIRKATTQEDG